MPQPDVRRRGPGQVIEINGQLIIIDCGAGVLHRLLESESAGKPIRMIALTHLHSDHTTGLLDLLWAGWVGRWWEAPPPLVGPPGTREFVTRLLHAFEADIRLRTAEGATSRERLEPPIHEVEDGWASECDDWRTSAFRVDHWPVEHAFGFRIESDGGLVVVSGDTRRCDSVIHNAEHADLLVHEVVWGAGMERLIDQADSPEQRASFERILDYHTPSLQVGEVAATAGVGHLVLSHLIFAGGSVADLITDVRQSFGGPVTVGEDLVSFSVGATRSASHPRKYLA